MSSERSSTRALLLVSSVLLPLAGCPVDDDGDDGGDDAGASTGMADDGSTGEAALFDEAEVIAAAADYETSLTKINAEPFASQHGLAATVNVYVSSDVADLYRGIDPDAPAEVAVPEGTLVVKEHLDGDGAFAGFTMMYRGPDGYDAAGGDWFWALVNAEGATQLSGSLGSCIGCHQPASSFLFGVPADNQL